MIYLTKQDIHATLTTWIYCAFAQAWSAEQQGKTFFINWPTGKFLQSYEDKEKFKQIPNAYHWYFVNPYVIQEPPTETWLWEKWHDPSPVGLMAQPLQVIKDFYKKHLHFNAETDRRGQAIVDKYKIDFSKTIGVTWRGTDVYLDGRPRIPIEIYFPFIDEILEKNPDFRIACTAEEEQIVDPLLNRYPNSFRIEEFYSVPFETKHNPERFSPMSGFERGLQPALMVWLFSKMAHYIKNRSSAAAVASWLSDGRIVSIAHEETLSYVKCDDYAEIDGVKYLLKK